MTLKRNMKLYLHSLPRIRKGREMSCDKCKIIESCDIKTNNCPCQTCLLKSICSNFCERFDTYCKETYTQKCLDDGHHMSGALEGHVHNRIKRLILYRCVDDIVRKVGLSPSQVK